MTETPFFKCDSRSSKVLTTLFQKGESRSYSKGADFDPFQKKDSASINQIVYGYVKVLTTDKEGNESVHLIYGKGDVFPLLNLMHPVNPQNVTFRALSNVRLYCLPVESLFNSMKKDIDVSNAVAEMLFKQFTLVIDGLENRSYKTAEEKIVYCLLILGARFGQKKDNCIELENIFTHNILGKMLGLSRETVSREFEKLRKKDLIKTPQHKIVLNDIKGLSDIVDAPLRLCVLMNAEKEKI